MACKRAVIANGKQIGTVQISIDSQDLLTGILSVFVENGRPMEVAFIPELSADDLVLTATDDDE